MKSRLLVSSFCTLILLGCGADPGATDNTGGEGTGASNGGGAGGLSGGSLPPLPPVSEKPTNNLPTSTGNGGQSTNPAAQSLQAFAETLAPILRENCSVCHSSPPNGAGIPPLHSDDNVTVAHDFAKTYVNLWEPQGSRIYRRIAVESHNCWSDCNSNATELEQAISQWAAGTLNETPPQKLGRRISENEVNNAIQNDRQRLSRDDQRFARYISLHELNNRSDVSALDMNTARVGMSKILNSTSRWAPEIVNPEDITGEGIIYRMDIRDYWGFSRGESQLPFGGPDVELPFNSNLFGRRGNVRRDPEFAQVVWNRIERGNNEALRGAKLERNIDGFRRNYVEVTQLAYTLSRPDVYNAVMQIPFFGNQLQEELELDVSNGRDSFEYMIVDDAITFDKRLMWRGETPAGYFWKSTDIFNPDNPFQNFEFQISSDDQNAEIAAAFSGGFSNNGGFFRNRDVFPFYENPLPRFINPRRNFSRDSSLSFVESVPADRFDPNGEQASAQELIFALPNGMQGYAIYGGTDQRRTDAFTFIVLDPRRGINSSERRARSLRLLNAASCMSCHENGMKTAPNDLRDKLDNNELREDWVNDPQIVRRVRELYPTTEEAFQILYTDRAQFLAAQDIMKNELIKDDVKTITEEPLGYLFEYAQRLYNYEERTGN